MPLQFCKQFNTTSHENLGSIGRGPGEGSVHGEKHSEIFWGNKTSQVKHFFFQKGCVCAG